MRVLVTGAGGFVGSRIVSRFAAAGHTVTAAARSLHALFSVSTVTLDLLDPASITAAFVAARPDAVVHAAALADLGKCESNLQLANRVNADGTALIADRCREHGARLIYLSTDQVFDGAAPWRRETDDTNPVQVYGQTKLNGEQAVLAEAVVAPNAAFCIARLALVYGLAPPGSPKLSAVEQILAAASAGETARLFTDEYRTPIHADDVAAACELLALLPAERLPPIIHVAGPDRLSRWELGQLIAERWRLDTSLLEPALQADLKVGLPRAKDVSLDTSILRGLMSPAPRSIKEGLDAVHREWVASQPRGQTGSARTS
ncbi:MAG: SDR family oxidoreductase [Phycisphaerales bacterium]|nr:SDR family oxidoreductase [Phycisphaerales bacterium]